ncbi:glycosyl transferase [Gluconacetobacter entanii]|uniref:Glycosyl transferase n=1 Tax=Gluconacetobacter entanii TaxID=108528 RepID=A0ABT3K461_9PROT|nr:glycosyl transferase [Gluconacetobacter entanii]MCW4590204.1 glycosyl transferase [Gluconacetobacter entanii]MCW4594323.1 glycosyl transferase [Gluconacetobacter entanii]
MRKVIVTGCDSGYFPLVMELIQSIGGRTDAALCVLDAGLSPQQVQVFSDLGVLVCTPHVPPCAPARQIRQRPTLAINLSKLWLDHVLPQFDLILWIDADAWVQDITAIEHMFDAARDGSLAIVPEIGAKIADMFAIRWICPGWMQVRSFLYKNARKARLPFSIRRRIGAKPLLNSGVMCLHRDADIWPVLRKWQDTIVRRGGALFTQDQLSIALAVYIDNARVTFLDNAHNYIGPWLLDVERGRLVNLFYPHDPVGIVHLVSQAQLRQSLSNTLSVPTLSGEEVALNLRFGGLQAFRRAHPASGGDVSE